MTPILDLKFAYESILGHILGIPKPLRPYIGHYMVKLGLIPATIWPLYRPFIGYRPSWM